MATLHSQISMGLVLPAVLGATVLAACSNSVGQPAAQTSWPPAPTTAVAITTKRSVIPQDNLLVALEFDNYLRQHDAPIPREDSELAYHRGVEICSSLDYGKTVEDLRTSWTKMLTADGAMIYIRGAVEHICPEHAEKVPAA